MFISLDQLSSKLFSTGKICIIEETSRGRTVYEIDQRLPLKSSPFVKYFPPEVSPANIVREIGAEKDKLYYIIPPKRYYRITLKLPFKEKERIEKVVKYEVLGNIPEELSDYVVAFFQLENGRYNGRLTPLQTYTVSKDEIKGVIAGFGEYSKNLRGLIPAESLYYAFLKRLELAGDRLFLDLSQDTIAILLISESGIFKSSTLELEGDLFPGQEFIFLIQAFLRDFTSGTVLVNMRSGVDDRIINQVIGILNKLEIKYRRLNTGDFPVDRTLKDKGYLSDMISAFGLLYQLQKSSQAVVNLLKEEFKPRFSGRIRLKEAIIIAVLLLVIGAMGITKVGLEASYYRNRSIELEDAIRKISLSVFKKPDIDAGEIRKSIRELEKNRKLMSYLLNPQYGASGLLEEVAFLIPGDIKLEFNELVIKRDSIRFSGKTTSFAEVDKLKEALKTSDIFKDVKVVSSSTTGSREGYTVSFVIEIDVKTGLVE